MTRKLDYRWNLRQVMAAAAWSSAIRWGDPSGVIDTETRSEQARWLLHDDSLKPEDRLVGLLVLLYAYERRRSGA